MFSKKYFFILCVFYCYVSLGKYLLKRRTLFLRRGPVRSLEVTHTQIVCMQNECDIYTCVPVYIYIYMYSSIFAPEIYWETVCGVSNVQLLFPMQDPNIPINVNHHASFPLRDATMATKNKQTRAKRHCWFTELSSKASEKPCFFKSRSACATTVRPPLIG